MAEKCRKGQHLIAGRCLSETRMRKMLQKGLVSDDWQSGGRLRSCLVEDSTSDRPGIAVIGKGRSIRLSTSWRRPSRRERCVFVKNLTKTEVAALSAQLLRRGY